VEELHVRNPRKTRIQCTQIYTGIRACYHKHSIFFGTYGKVEGVLVTFMFKARFPKLNNTECQDNNLGHDFSHM